MSDSSVHTTQLQLWVDRIRAGDVASREELLRGVWDRLERLAHKMFRRFPRVGRWVEAADVLQNALLRLLRALEQVRPESMRAFFGLAAEQMRRELLDLARHFLGPQGLGANYRSLAPAPEGGHNPHDPPDVTDDPADLDRWRAFHEEVAKLPEEEREVVDLLFYHGWTQAEVAELLEVSPRTVQRRWGAALVKLHRILEEVDPGSAPPTP
ncbi:MAG: sigma-70 family RNA polymerase sigma factor [Planctomycetes bacterium]|nr:sigma-70 family RNA polymerase sigma factor [Planctomycetota bacterium]